jgi:hypothetical protein
MHAITASDAVDLISSMGLAVEVKSFDSVAVAETNARLFVRQRPPSPSSIRVADGEQVRLYVVPRLTDGLRRVAAADHRIAIAAIRDGIFILDGQEHRVPAMESEVRPVAPTRRVPWGRYALLRVLARTGRPRTQTRLAAEAGVTQAAVSQSLKQLGDLVVKSPDGWSARDVRAVANSFLTQYPGPRGITTAWFSLAPVVQQASTVASLMADGTALISGDTGADLIAPWRAPGRAVVYGRAGLNLAPHGFAEAELDRASLEYTVPADPTLWATAQAFADVGPRLTADPLICAHDVLRIGGPDVDDAVERLLAAVERNWSAE